MPSRGLARSEFEAAYEYCVGPIYRYAQRRLGPSMAEEIAAQTFAEAWRTRDRYQSDRGTPAAWLYGIAANIIRRDRREEARQLRAFAASGTDPAWVVEDADRVIERLRAGDEWPKVADALAGMKPTDRDIITLYCWEGLTYREVADALDLPIGTVRSRLSRARTRLAAAVGRSQAGPEE
ncbi:MAG: RNA polymerase sigma factor [Actinobacteria bacterium]|nr:RNA polymerase sigma factor [Actinomycetota bacterium]